MPDAAPQSPPTVPFDGVRELSDALRRRCPYHWLDLPDSHEERRILETCRARVAVAASEGSGCRHDAVFLPSGAFR